MSNFKKPLSHIAATLVVAMFFIGCSSDEDVLADISNIAPKPVEVSINTTIIYSDSAVLRLKIVTPELQRWTNLETPYIEFPKGLHLFFYDSLGNVESTLTADYAINYTEEKRVEVKHHVEVINGKHDILNTEHLIWLQKEEKIYTEEFVKITTPDEIIYGDGLEANQQFTKYRIKNIKGTIAVDEDSLQ